MNKSLLITRVIHCIIILLIRVHLNRCSQNGYKVIDTLSMQLVLLQTDCSVSIDYNMCQSILQCIIAYGQYIDVTNRRQFKLNVHDVADHLQSFFQAKN